MTAEKNEGGSGGGSLYFVVGNGWLFVALILYLGRFTARSSPTYYAFFSEHSAWLTPVEYYALMIACLAAAVFCFGLHLTRRHST